MAAQAKIKIRYDPQTTWSSTQISYPGPAFEVVELPDICTDANSRFISKAGSDSNPGTYNSPFLTIGKALSVLPSGYVYAAIKDSGIYNEKLDWNVAGTCLRAKSLNTPTVKIIRGAIPGTYGSRTTGIAQSTGAPTTFYYVNQTTGNDGTGTRGDATKPFKHIQAALNDGSRVADDTIEITDSKAYVEDLDANGKAVTIQALLGQLPILTKVTLAGIHVGNTGAACVITLYGLKLIETAGATGSICSGGSTNKYVVSDCTLQGDNYAIRMTAAGASFDLKNCLLFGQNVSVVSSQNSSICTISNCYTGLTNCSGPVVNFYGLNFNAAISQSSFVGCQGNDSIINLDLSNSNTSGGSITGCVFSGSAGRRLSHAIKIGGIYTQYLSGSTGMISNCYFSYFDNSPVVVYHLCGGGVNSSFTVTADNCVAYQCASITGEADFYFVTDGYGNNPSVSGTIFTCTNCSSLDSGGCGFFHNACPGTLASSNASFVCVNCTSINAAGNGFSFAYGCSTNDGNPAFSMVGCAEYGSGGYGLGVSSTATPVVATVSYSCLQKSYAAGGVATISVGNKVLIQDPMFLSTSPGLENIGLQPTSPCWFTGSATGSKNMGYDISEGYTLKISALNVSVGGIIISGDINFQCGLYCPGLAASVKAEQCEFSGLGSVGAQVNSLSAVTTSVFSTNGNAVVLTDYQAEVSYNVAYACGGAFLVNYASNSTIKNNSTYDCLYGQWDALGVNGCTLTNNIYSASGVYDYSGDQVFYHSCLGTLDPDRQGSLDSVDVYQNSTRKNPLYRDPGNGDLRLQEIAVSTPGADPPVIYYFNSPCQLAGNDGYDMGAFRFSFGGSTTNWTTVDFGTAGYRNPDEMPRFLDPIHYAEIEREDGSTEATMAAVEKRFTLKWRNVNDMPSQQVEDLNDLFSCLNCNCQIEFTGGSDWKDCVMLKKTPMEWEEITPMGYTTDSVPTPVKELEFRLLP